MPMTTKERNQLQNAKDEMMRLWTLMCRHDDIDPASKFAAFSPDNPYSARHGELVTAFMKLRNQINRKVAARERRAAIRDAYASAGMVKVHGNLGGTYYE